MPEQNTETRPNRSGKYGVLARIRLGRAALSLAAIEVPASIASVTLGSPLPIAAGTLASLWVAGETLHDLHNNRNHPPENLHSISRWLAKDNTVK